jgi:YidC/Oxa1 family membrane protein insertase
VFGSLFDLSLLASFASMLSGLPSQVAHLVPLFSFPSPPGWKSYVNLLEHILDFLADKTGSAGLGVILFTIGVKTLLLPLTVTSIKSSKAMQELQPKIKELQKKYGKDRARLSQETMALYQAHKVNPMAGCLPVLIQMPIFFGVYRAIAHLSEGKGFAGASHVWEGSFLWLNSLNDADPYKILPILAGVFQFMQTKMMRPANQGKIEDPQQAMMNMMMNIMPLTVVFFGWGFASGPVIYWVTQSIYSVVQQWFITGWGSVGDWIPGLPELPEHRRLGYRAPRDIDDVVVMSGENAPEQKGFSGWMARKMKEAQEQQAARQAAARGNTTTKSTSSIQKKVDAEVQRSSAPKGPRPVKKEVRAQQRRQDSTASRNGASAPVVPRKSRPTRKSDSSSEEATD